MTTADSTPANHSDLSICAFETRKGSELRSLLERQGLTRITLTPSMREIPLAENTEAFRFAERLFAGEIDLVILLTGVGTRALAEVLDTRYPRADFLAALQRAQIIVRGPKPAAVLREWKVRIDYQVPEPNTWRDLLVLLDEKAPVAGRRVAIQEYGAPHPELCAALEQRGAQTFSVPVYRWALPEDTTPLRESVHKTIAGEFDVLLFTSAQQLRHVQEIAEAEGVLAEWRAALTQCVVASIGPTASETIREAGLPVDIEPEHPKMGHLAQAVARDALDIRRAKRR
ncbi:MAG: uroporphyrinogen-III synthase [Planctomycetes bacterium]|nr:uroporphyrinogen-III synthase [Planctomycetota bacterium]